MDLFQNILAPMKKESHGVNKLLEYGKCFMMHMMCVKDKFYGVVDTPKAFIAYHLKPIKVIVFFLLLYHQSAKLNGFCFFNIGTRRQLSHCSENKKLLYLIIFNNFPKLLNFTSVLL